MAPRYGLDRDSRLAPVNDDLPEFLTDSVTFGLLCRPRRTPGPGGGAGNVLNGRLTLKLGLLGLAYINSHLTTGDDPKRSFSVWLYIYLLSVVSKLPSGKPLVSYTPESVTMAQSEEYRYERKTVSRRV